jgi:FkbM family methyltransferase
MSIVSYAQNSEDVLLHRVFGGQETGFYVDVGAYHPVIGSVTKMFYDRGWSGINVEPGSVFQELAAERPRDVNLQMAVMDRAGEIGFIENDADRGTSYVTTGEDGGGTGRMVACDTLEGIVRKHSRGRPVDFVKLDAEGSEESIVRSTDWRRLRPHVLLIEATLPWSIALINGTWEPTLLEQGYIRAYFDGINCFYIPAEEEAVLLRHFQVPVNALDRVIHHDEVTQRSELSNLRAKAAHLTAERDSLTRALDTQKAELMRMTADSDGIRRDLNEKQSEVRRLTAERNGLTQALDTQKAELARMEVDSDGIHRDLNDLQSEVRRLTAERDAIWVQLEEEKRLTAQLTANRGQAPEDALSVESGVTMVPAPTARTHLPRGRTGSRRLAMAAYRLVRPIARPMAWRLRSFLVGGISEQVRQLSVLLDTRSASVRSGQLGDVSGANYEMVRLAGEMERTLLTLAMERNSDVWIAGPRDMQDAERIHDPESLPECPPG